MQPRCMIQYSRQHFSSGLVRRPGISCANAGSIWSAVKWYAVRKAVFADGLRGRCSADAITTRGPILCCGAPRSSAVHELPPTRAIRSEVAAACPCPGNRTWLRQASVHFGHTHSESRARQGVKLRYVSTYSIIRHYSGDPRDFPPRLVRKGRQTHSARACSGWKCARR